MNQGKLIALGILILIGLVIVTGTLYTVDEREKAIVVRFGEVVRYDDTAGFHAKVPFLESVRFYDSRILTMNAEPRAFITNEKKSVVVDSYVKWRIVDVLKYYVSVGGDELKARERLSQVINSGLRDEFGKRTVQEVISGDRRKVMELLTVNADKEAGEYGISVVDVRIQRVDLPPKVSESVYDRMRAERTRIAKELRAQGGEEAEKIRADADRQREVLLAEAYRDGQRIRGEGDSRATAIYAQAYNRDPKFFGLYRSLNAYKEGFQGKDDVMVLDPSADFFKYFRNPNR